VVPVPRETRAQGQAIFQLSRDRAHLSYRVIASNIENVVGARTFIALPRDPWGRSSFF
jgi:hypothetical protein